MSIADTYYTPAQIAVILQLNVLTIYNYIKSGQLAAIKFGRTYRVRKSDLERFIAGHTTSKQKNNV